jgi:alpha-tubulin suppressor-like RCC1 family protein
MANKVRKQYEIVAPNSGSGMTQEWVCPANVSSINVIGLNRRKIMSAARTAGFIEQNGQIYMMGDNVHGQLGDNTVVPKSSATLVVGAASGLSFKEIAVQTEVATSKCHSLALDYYGRLWAWGLNEHGQLGDQTVVPKSTPVLIATDQKFRKIALSNNSSFAIDVNDDLYAWGDNTHGQIGDDTNVPKSSPVIVDSSKKWRSVFTSEQYGCFAITQDGDLYSWGVGEDSLANGNLAVSTPTLVTGTQGYKEISAGLVSVGIKYDGSTFVWGYGDSYGLGDGTLTAKSTPTAIAGGHQFISVASGNGHCLGLKSNGEIWAWGRNGQGQLGTDDTVDTSSPVLVAGSGTDRIFKHIQCGTLHSWGVDDSGALFYWGTGSGGKGAAGGGGTFASSPTPVVNNHIVFSSDKVENQKINFPVTPGQTYKVKNFASMVLGSEILVLEYDS